jgi:prevent-host-death family protein
MLTIDIEQARSQFSALMEQALRGEEVVITRDARPVAKLVPVSDVRGKPRFGSAKGKVRISDDFDAPLEDFRAYME